MISLDDPKKNHQFAASLGAVHILLSDLGGAVADQYGVTALGGLYARRWSFYIDPEGVIRYIDKDVKTATAGQDIAERLAVLGFPKAKSE